jgi:hypothetical protein
MFKFLGKGKLRGVEAIAAHKVEKLQKIKWLCAKGKLSARNFLDDSLHDEIREYENNMYEDHKRGALLMAREIREKCIRNEAFCCIIDLYMVGDDADDAMLLLEAIEEELVREAILESYPRLRNCRQSDI